MNGEKDVCGLIGRVRIKLRTGSLLWRYLLMITSVLLLALLALTIISKISIDRLNNEKISEMRMTLERDAGRMEADMLSIGAIPAGIETSDYYALIKADRSTSFDKKYYPILTMLRKSLLNQIRLHGASSETLLYFGRVNSIITNRYVYPEAEACFEEGYLFAEESLETVLSCLRTWNCQRLLPLETVEIMGDVPQRYLTFVVHPLDSSIAVMSMYSETQVLEMLGYALLPEGAFIQITADDGQALFAYPAGVGEVLSAYQQITSELSQIHAVVSVYVPNSCFEKQLLPTRIMLTFITAMVIMVGLAVSFLLSRAAVAPLRQLITRHGGEQQGECNEIEYLDDFINKSTDQKQELQRYLARQLLSRALSGVMLTEAEEEMLKESRMLTSGSYCVAILHTGSDLNMNLGAYLQEQPGCVSWTILNKKETGCIVKGSCAAVQQFIQSVDRFGQSILTEYPKGVCCGVSAIVSSVSELYAASHQARTSIPQKKGCRIFDGELLCDQGMSWVQHERLYQSIFTNDRVVSERIINILAEKANQQNGKELFYNIRLVLRSAAEELGILLSSDQTEYDERELPKENLERLRKCLLEVHDAIQQQQDCGEKNMMEQIVSYVRADMNDSNLCAASVAEHFGISEKRVYEAVRQVTDMSFGEFLVSVRMKRAAKLLSTTQDSIADIMEACGYPGSSTFYRIFKKFHGVPPGAYRNVIVEENSEDGGAKP